MSLGKISREDLTRVAAWLLTWSANVTALVSTFDAASFLMRAGEKNGFNAAGEGCFQSRVDMVNVECEETVIWWMFEGVFERIGLL